MMNGERKEYTFFWHIENYSYWWHENVKELKSPTFGIDGLEGTAWFLSLFPSEVDDGEGHVSLFLNRSNSDDGPEKFSIEYELSVLSEDGSSLSSKQEYTFEKGDYCEWESTSNMNEIFFDRKNDSLQQDVLKVSCKIWKGEGSVVHNMGQSSARTRIKVERISFFQVVKNFSTFARKESKNVEIRFPSKEKYVISGSLHFTECSCGEEKLVIEIIPSDARRILRKCDIYALDSSGNVKECGKVDNRNECNRTDRLPLSVTIAELLNRKDEYLPDDKLSLLFKCTFSNGIEFQTIEEILHEIPLALIEKTNDVPRTNACKALEDLSNYPSGLEDIKKLYIDKSLTDVQLKTKTKSFPAHKVVLFARSPVFKTMMSSDMKEKNSNCIQIGDLEDDVVQQLLLFLYSDTVENLQWGMAARLYYAADKYEIGRLKEVCSSFFLENLTPTTAGELLLLADTHGDGSLKKMVEDFILEHEELVFGSDEWEKIMETNPVLAMKALHLKYKKKKNNMN